jgi:ABC-type dipeptide/oligopeptide/nickel transport system permease component
MSTFLVRRSLRALLTLVVVLSAVFVATRLTGDPTLFLLPDDASPAMRSELRATLGVDGPLVTQYVAYLGALARGEFGTSYYERRPVADMLGERIGPTFLLAICSLALALALGIPAGILAALHRDSPLDRAVMTLSFSAYAVPNFVLGIGLIFLFSLTLRWLPSSGSGGWEHLVMPVVTLGASSAALLARLTRGSVLDTLYQDYVRTARSKGLAQRAVVLKHVMRNAFTPVLTVLGLQIGTIVAGSVVVETVFAWPGVGRMIVRAVQQRDFPVLQFAVVVVAASVVVANLIVDLAYAVIDPRVRYGDGA